MDLYVIIFFVVLDWNKKIGELEEQCDKPDHPVIMDVHAFVEEFHDDNVDDSRVG